MSISDQMRSILSEQGLVQEDSDKNWSELDSHLGSVLALVKRMMPGASPEAKKMLDSLFRAARDVQKYWDGE